MSPFNSLILASIVWMLLHLGVSGTALRALIVDAIGAGTFRIVFSLVSVAVIYWLASSYGKAGAVRILWTSPHWLIVACMLLLLPALLLLVGSGGCPIRPWSAGNAHLPRTMRRAASCASPGIRCCGRSRSGRLRTWS